MQKNQSGFSAFLVLAVILVVGAIGYSGWYVWRLHNPQPRNNSSLLPYAPNVSQTDATPKPNTPATKTLILNRTDYSYADWKTYTSTTVSFSYPTGLKVGVGGESGAITAQSPDLSGKVAAGSDKTAGASISINTNNESLATITHLALINDNGNYSDVQYARINSKNAILYRTTQEIAAQRNEVTDIAVGNGVYEIMYSGPGSADYLKYLPVYYQLLASLTF